MMRYGPLFFITANNILSHKMAAGISVNGLTQLHNIRSTTFNDNTGTTIKSEVTIEPVTEYHQFVSETQKAHKVYRHPYHPGHISTQFHTCKFSHSVVTSYCCHTAKII